MRNMIRTQMCPKVLKGKECTFAHVVTDIRKTKCMVHIHNICSYENSCKHDHSNFKLPEFPVKQHDEIIPTEVTLEDIESLPLSKVTIEDFPRLSVN